MKYKAYYSTFSGHYIGGSAIVIARHRGHALELLKERLAKEGITNKRSLLDENQDLTIKNLIEIPTDTAEVWDFNNGDY